MLLKATRYTPGKQKAFEPGCKSYNTLGLFSYKSSAQTTGSFQHIHRNFGSMQSASVRRADPYCCHPSRALLMSALGKDCLFASALSTVFQPPGSEKKPPPKKNG
jgi:hypothetical protein